MPYQSQTRRCRTCQKPTTHWREVPELSSNWMRAMDQLPAYLWNRLATPWNCRGCVGVPKGPLGVRPRPRRGSRPR